MRFGSGPHGPIAAAAARATAGALAAGLLWAAFGWRPWRAQGWPGLAPGVAGFGRGTVIGLAMATAVIGIQVLTGGARFTGTGDPFGAYLRAAGNVGIILVVAALSEELLFRGLPLMRLADAVGRVPAVVVLTAGFTGLHLANPGVTVLGLANIALASVVLSAAFFEWGGIPAAWGLHFGWNAGLGVGADAPVSGIEFNLPGFDLVETGPDWLTGGLFGPEGGLIATLVMAVAAAGLLRPTFGVRGVASPAPVRARGQE
jgi:membrane protease YdiL (CAAX protease family)